MCQYISAPGGKQEAGERPSECAAREVQEEVGIRVTNLVCRAELRFIEQQGPQWLGYAFTTREFSGVARQSVEADPFWCRRADIPYAKMWDDDQLWLPLILAQEQRQARGLLIADLLFHGGRLLERSLMWMPPPLAVLPLLHNNNNINNNNNNNNSSNK